MIPQLNMWKYVKEDKVIPWKDIERGYEVKKGQYVVFQGEELKAAKPESDQRIRSSR